MGILDLLAKLGILRYGAKTGTYKNAKERPAEFMMENVYNADRDLVTGDDRKPAAKPAEPPAGKSDAR